MAGKRLMRGRVLLTTDRSMVGASSVGAGAKSAAAARSSSNDGDESKAKELMKKSSHFTRGPTVVESIKELYTLDESNSLGKGSFGEVLCGHPVGDPETMYAVKLLSKARFTSEKEKKAVRLEVDILKRLSGHEHMVGCTSAPRLPGIMPSRVCCVLTGDTSRSCGGQGERIPGHGVVQGR